MKFFAEIHIMPREEVLNPPGNTLAQSMKRLDLMDVEKIRMGKRIEVVFEAESENVAESKVKTACEKLLANTITETFFYSVHPFVEESVD